MSTILTIYSKQAFKRVLLPAVNNADHEIFLAESLFDLTKSIVLRIENKENTWYFTPSEEYEIKRLSSDDFEYSCPLVSESDKSKNDYKLLVDGKHIITIMSQQTEDSLSIYDHFDIAELSRPVSIGRDVKNVIAYDFEDKHMLSGDQATLFKKDNKYYFQDLKSANGSYINNRRVSGSHELTYGDCIDLFGLRIVFLGTTLAVNVLESKAVINENLLKKVAESPSAMDRPNTKQLTKVFHRSPRQFRRLETDAVKIDDPPASKDQVKRTGILMALGSALSMSIPMLLGCAFMIYASRVSGISRGLFMYVGLVTAVASAIMATIRGVTGMRKAVKDYEEYEKLRNERYGAYLRDEEKIIRSKYDRNTKVLCERYASAKECSLYTSDTPSLWGRNVNQPDFLTHRLGIGDLRFQVDIQVPEKKFTMIDNNLMNLPEDIKKKYSVLKNVPICVDLLEHMLVGVIGGRRMAGGIKLVRDLVVQIAANNAYTDVKIALIYDKNQDGLDKEWDFVRWLPHTWNETKTFRYIASDKEEASNVLYELNKLIRQRIEDQNGFDGTKKRLVKPYYILVVAAPHFLEGELISQYLLEPEAAYGFSTVYMTEKYEQLPNNCDFIIENDEEFRGLYNVSDDIEERVSIKYDELTVADAEKFATCVANIELQEIEESGEIPDTISFFDMYGINKLDELDVLTRWRKNRTYESIKALIGLKGGSAPCYLDIHEKYHGPHGLVAGTTGSGKSETLQTFILSLAINYSPDDISFFIIDYKGGGMANLLENLPHMIGQISNLSGNQINRALLSIQSEKERREALFAKYGVKDIRDYTKLYKNNEAAVPLPHLIIVIDEFAEMKKEEPEFIQEIISLSRVGRSLGIHLIMATQKPSGSVSDDIWANSRFKLCLRVQSKQDSSDMLHKPDAAYLTQSGRCYLQVGNDELYELFQSGYSGAVYSEDSFGESSIAKMLTVDGTLSIEGNHARLLKQKEKKIAWIEELLLEIKSVPGVDENKIAGYERYDYELLAASVFQKLKYDSIDYPENEHNKENLITLFEWIGRCGFDARKIVENEEGFTNAKKKLPQEPEKTQLEAVVSYLQEVAMANNYTHDFSLFMPLLPEKVDLGSIPDSRNLWKNQNKFDGEKWPSHSGEWGIETEIGIYDDPENQRQDAVVINFEKMGNLLVFGAPNTGKTTLLQTLVYGMINRYSPAEINLYLIEYSAHKFSPFEKMPHIGGIITENDPIDKLEKLFVMLAKELVKRKSLFGDVGFSQYVKINGYESIPAVFVIIDGFGVLNNRTGDRFFGSINNLVKEGINYGLFIIATAGGISSSEIPNSVAQNFKSAICLELNNTYDYATYLRANRLKMRPESGVTGRGLVYVGDRVLEFQTAVPFYAENEFIVNETIRQESEKMDVAWDGEKPRCIPEIPQKPLWTDFVVLRDTRELINNERLFPVGYDAQSAEPVGLDLSKYYVVLITGSKKKGKTNAIKVFMNCAYEKKARLVVVDFNQNLSIISSMLGARYIDSEKAWGQYLDEMLRNDVVARNTEKGRLRQLGAEDEDVYLGMQKFEPIFIFIDDVVTFIEKIIDNEDEKDEISILENMEMLLDAGALHNIYWIVSLDKENTSAVSSTNLYKLFVKEYKGIHLGGNARTNALSGMAFDNFDRRVLDAMKPAGHAMVPLNNEEAVNEIVLPLVKVRQS
ncbi:type VII secretion protein EssC [Pseudobutyrivibrio sp.]|uniref:type VII secretion protein EssC n=1 Tax=Pseudobutyrivibrio sp. TaxID=2014367 RepID=UPI001DDDB7E7|nr:type VII secretion protein EssC [Pseudobutyrivibrio sp.]MBE5912021.1 type VII secretion protein EssC [Pseudobutyrivibrio sp.]